MSDIGAEEVVIELGESGPIIPPADVTSVPLLAGCANKGPYNKGRLIATQDDLAEFEGGPLTGLSAALVAAGRTHVVVRCKEGPLGFYGPVEKEFGNPHGQMVGIPGAATWPGVSPNGQLLAEALALDVTLQMFVVGKSATLTVPPVPAGSKNVVVQLGSDMAAAETSLANDVIAAVAAVPSAAALCRLSLPPASDGKGIVKSQGSAYVLAFNDGAVAFQALAGPLTLNVSTPTTPNAVLSVVLKLGVLTIANGTNAQRLPTTTPTELQTAMARPDLAAAVAMTSVGSGMLLSALSVGGISLPFGSGGTCVPLGQPLDRADVVVQVVRAGVVGVDPPPTIRWSLDDADSLDAKTRGGSWSGETTVPKNGLLDLADDLFVSGIKVKLSGPMDEGDTYRVAAYGPEPSTNGLLDGINAVFKDPQFDFGYVVPVGPVDAAQEMAIDSVVQRGPLPPVYRHTYALVNSRDQGANETDPDYEGALFDDFFGPVPVQSPHGLSTLVNGWGRHRNPMAQRWQRRPAHWYYAMTRALRPTHEQPGNRNDETGPGTAQNFGFSIFYHDANRHPGLRMRGRASSVVFEKNRGWYATEWVTLAPTSSNYRKGPWMSVIIGAAAILQTAAVNFKLDSIDANPDNTVAGSDKNAVSRKLSENLEPFLYEIGVDRRPNARRNPPEYPLVQVLDNDVVNSGDLLVLAQLRPMPYVRMVKIKLLLSTQAAQ